MNVGSMNDLCLVPALIFRFLPMQCDQIDLLHIQRQRIVDASAILRGKFRAGDHDLSAALSPRHCIARPVFRKQMEIRRDLLQSRREAPLVVIALQIIKLYPGMSENQIPDHVPRCGGYISRIE